MNEDNRVRWLGLPGVLHGIRYQEVVVQKLLAICLILSLLFVICFSAFLFLALREEKPVYFGVNQEMQILPLYPLDEPMYTDAAVTAWAAEAASSIFNLDFLNWREQIAGNRRFFTQKAFISFRRSLKDEGHLAILSQYRALMHGVPGIPLIVAAGVLKNRMTWELEIPFRLAYETSDKVLSEQDFIITMRIQRMSTAEYVKGIAISQMIVTKKGQIRQKQNL
ncbi:MAG: DotI/IcmL/TraM family protein [Desulfovibrionaceae bacterium]|nr:DotI/IcmL/TraM family protein [Desulfovibrionaceae bacterium]